MGMIITRIIFVAVIVLFGLVIVSQADILTKNDFYKSRSTSILRLADSVYDPPVDWPVCNGIQRTGVINASFSSQGLFGVGYLQSYNDSPNPLVSFETQPDSRHEYLYGAAIWVGGIVGNDTLVSIGHSGWSADSHEFTPQFGPGLPA